MYNNNDQGCFYMDDSYLNNRPYAKPEIYITDGILIKSGFIRSSTLEFDKLMSEECPGYRSYEKSVDGKYFIDVTFGISNIDNGKNWNVHIDNCDRMSIGSADISTIGQFNDFMKIFNINLKL